MQKNKTKAFSEVGQGNKNTKDTTCVQISMEDLRTPEKGFIITILSTILTSTSLEAKQNKQTRND